MPSVAVERTAGETSLIDVLDRVLDKGIVIDAWVRVSLVDLDLTTAETRVVLVSIDTYLKYSEAGNPSRPATADADPMTLPRRSSEDDDDEGNSGSGTPALIYVELQPRRLPPIRPARTRDAWHILLACQVLSS
jgi:hypothetical protein